MINKEWNIKRGVIILNDESPFYKLKSIPLSAVEMEKGFWKERMDKNRENGLLKLLQLFEEHGIVDNFRRLNGKSVKRRGEVFSDSDLYKWMEAVSWILSYTKDSELKNKLDEIVDIVVSAQEDSGYINTYFVDEHKKERFKKMGWSHELYCGGHLIQAGIANKRATGDEKLLNSGVRFADFLCENFGPGKIEEADGHPEIEMALIELYRETKKEKYLNLAEFFLKKVNYKKLKEIWGHAVRAMYYNCGLIDLYAETGDREILEILRLQWDSMVNKKMYITGGIGSRYELENFGQPYELPNERSYAETCASIGNIFWNWRMLCVNSEAKYADLMEKILYNGFLSGVSLNGDKYFYVNPLQSQGREEINPWSWPEGGLKIIEPIKRKYWYDCTCCPPNVLRMFATLPNYFYSISSEGIWIHLYGNNKLNFSFNETKFTLTQKTDYPWDGKIEIELTLEKPLAFSIFLRIPEWCEKYDIKLNGSPIKKVFYNNYLEIKRKWRKKEIIHLNFEMGPYLMECNPRVSENRDSIAIQYGPLIYCLESIDNPEISLLDLMVKINEDGNLVGGLKREFREDLLDGVIIIEGNGEVILDENYLYRKFQVKNKKRRKVRFKAIPYYAWANRGISSMKIWIPYEKCEK